NLEEGKRWLLKCGEERGIPVCLSLAASVENDKGRAFELELKAAHRGNAIAANNVGVAYHKGIGTEINYVEAIYWYRRALSQGDKTHAAGNIELLRREGWATP